MCQAMLLIHRRECQPCTESFDLKSGLLSTVSIVFFIKVHHTRYPPTLVMVELARASIVNPDTGLHFSINLYHSRPYILDVMHANYLNE